MPSNLQSFDAHQGQKGNLPAPGDRAAFILRAYIDSPSGKAVEAVFRALSSLNPPPSYQEAEDLAQGVPQATRERALSWFRTACLGAEDRQGCADGGRGHFDPCECPWKPRTGQRGATAEQPAQEPPGAPRKPQEEASQVDPWDRAEYLLERIITRYQFRQAEIRGLMEQAGIDPRARLTPDRPYRGVFGRHIPAQVANLEDRIREAVAILRGPGDRDAQTRQIGYLLFPQVEDVTERNRLAGRFVIRAILSGSTTQPAVDWSPVEPQPFDLLAEEGRGE